MSNPPLRPLHADSTLIKTKLDQLEQLSTEVLRMSLLPGRQDCLKTREDGTMLDGHHRIYVLRKRGVNVDALPREISIQRSYWRVRNCAALVDGPWPGRLALAARPRGGEWLEDEIGGWKEAGIDVILSLLTPEEEHDLGLNDEAREARAHGLQFLSLPVQDRGVPERESDARATVERVNSLLSQGENVVVHCRQGVGRTGLLAACLLVSRGIPPDAAVDTLSSARGVPVPETPEQRRWINEFASIATNGTRLTKI